MIGTSKAAGSRRAARWWVALLAVLVVGVGLPLAPPASAADAGGLVVAWGPDNEYGQASVPAGLSGVTAVAAGPWHSLALKSNGTVVAWGNNEYGQATVPEGLSGVTAIDAGSRHNLALKANGTVVAWGRNDFGQATVPEGLSGVTAIAAGSSHSLALKGDGTVVAWGYNEYGQATVPAGLSGVTAIAAGSSHSLALKSDGTVVAWGAEYESNVPAGLTGVTAIADGGWHSLALRSDGTVVAWGDGPSGQVAVPAGLSGVTAISAGYELSLALKSDGTVVDWGWDQKEGQTAVPAGLSDVAAIAAGAYHSLAVGKLRRPDLLIGKAAAGPYFGNDLYNTPGVEGQTLTSTARRGRVRDFYVRVRNDGNTIGAFTVRGSASMRGSVVRYFSAGVEITRVMRSAGGWHPVVPPGGMRQLRAQVRIGSRAVIGSLKSATVTATWQGRAPDAVKGVVRVIR